MSIDPQIIPPSQVQVQPPLEKLLQLYNDPFLSDCILHYNDQDISIHKAIVASASKYLFNAYKQNTITEKKDNKDLVTLPEVVISSFSKGEPKNCLLLLLKYCYSNQVFEAIQDEVTEENIFTILAYAHCLQILSLIEHLEKRLVNTMLKQENMIPFLNEGIMFELPQLKESCLEMIKEDFTRIMTSPSDITMINDFNYEMFKNVMSSDELKLKNEKDVCDLIIGYIKSRRLLEVQQPVVVEPVIPPVEEKPKEPEPIQPPVEEKKPEEEPPKQEEEKKPEEEQPKEEEKKAEEEPPKQEEEKKPEEEAPKQEEEKKPEEQPSKQEEEKKLEEPIITNPPNQPPINLLSNWKDHINTLKKSLDKVQLTKEQERDLIQCIRFSFLSHSDLISLTTDPIIKDHQDLVLEGLSVRLNSYETTDQTSLKINLTPRTINAIPPAQPNNQNPSLHPGSHHSNPIPSLGNQSNKRSLTQSNKDPNQEDQMNIYQSLPMNQQRQEQTIKQSSKHSYSKGNKHNDSMDQEIINVDELSKQKKTNKADHFNHSQRNPRPPQDPIISLDFYKNMSMVAKPNPSFKYEYDFDDNGVFYYLGTLGRLASYQNPYERGQVKVFASSTGKGSLGDFIGRESVNLRTLNEENSFIGVDLGQERFLIPSCYSIKNRNSASHVMLCWQLEGSNDKLSYDVLDSRIFSNASNAQHHQSLEKERNMLKQPGCTSTWGINKKIREEFPNGFRYFILKQISSNSSGGHNLAISGFELYGDALGRNWSFN